MNKFVLLVLIGSLAFITEGCSYFSKFAESRKELEKETAPIPVRVDTAQTESEKTEDLFADLEEEELEALPEIAGLIPATNPEDRVRSSVRGRNDPFSILTLNPRIQIDEERRKDLNAPKDRSQISNRQNQNQNRAPVNNDNSLSDLPTPEEVFEPTLAEDVVISGLFEADGRTRIIVQAPEESSSRYVEVGQYLSNGQVLVKRIDKDHFPSPMIILEQSGVEVAKMIGADLNGEDRISSLPATAPSNSWDTAISLK